MDDEIKVISVVRKASGPLDWISRFEMTENEMDAIAEPEFVYRDLIIKGHIVAVVADPMGGKTSILFFIAGEMVKAGYKVAYVNADVGATGSKHYFALAQSTGVRLLLPDMKSGLSMKDVIASLETMNDSGQPLDGVVFIFDTLKKMVDVINKSLAKKLYNLLRSLTAKGMTVVLACHTNKYKDADGHPIYEGTGDLRSDVDDLIYLVKTEQPGGALYVSTDTTAPTAKTRGAIKPMTFVIEPDRTVYVKDQFVDVIELNRERDDRLKDQLTIELISAAITDGVVTQSGIVKRLSADDISRRAALRVLGYYTNRLWTTSTGSNNSVTYQLK